ncbi:DUF3817 domain-containing protein [Denitrobaculum tricleocarpae]|uniref:DUF3817 domain-containing protein n=2 Tax=Denitrobaculum tricleocarpae TaxID=2591009 RepID=A0A545T5R8_9PROT|nr:DUF3817 domain-containing protein [Denitrobaculum tricleocarpae]
MGAATEDLQSAARQQLQWIRTASLLEGVTLVILVFVAVPLKHLAGIDAASATMGPIHGTAFLIYIWTLAHTASFFGWRKGEILRLFLFAFVPLGAIANARWLKQKEAAGAFGNSCGGAEVPPHQTDHRDGVPLA